MCRLFGLLAGEPVAARPWLLDGPSSLLALSNVSEEEAQHDGWGIAWFADRRTPRIEKGTGGAFEPGEVERFRAIAEIAKGPVVLGHLRKASNPLKLPRARLIAPENSQPFSSGSDLFAHNGMIPLPRETRPRLGPFESRVKGVNDSEVLFWLLARRVEETGDPIGAYAGAVRDLAEVWEARGRPEGGPYTGLNILFTRGPNELWAFCHWRGDHGTGFRDGSRPYYQMAYRADSKLAVVASEPMDERTDWRPLANGEFLHAQAAHGLVAVRTGSVPLGDLPAPDPAAPSRLS